MMVGTSVSGMLVVQLVYLLARRCKPYAAVLKVGRVVVKEYGQVLSWEGITWVGLMMGSSSSSGCTGYIKFSWACSASSPSGVVGRPAACMWVSWLLSIFWIVVLWSTW